MMPPRPAIFLDLNGTLVLPVQAAACSDYTLIDGCAEAVRLLNAAGYLCPVVTVQSRIAKGVYSEANFIGWFTAFQEMLRESKAEILGPYVCPHRSRDACACAKPKPLLYQTAVRELHLDLSRSFVIGDTAGDMEAALALGVPGYLVRTGWGPQQAGAVEEQLAAYTGRDLLEVAHWITHHSEQQGQRNNDGTRL